VLKEGRTNVLKLVVVLSADALSADSVRLTVPVPDLNLVAELLVAASLASLFFRCTRLYSKRFGRFRTWSTVKKGVIIDWMESPTPVKDLIVSTLAGSDAR
jgi:hypothetical protein